MNAEAEKILTDTIVAPASAPYNGAVGIVRLSGSAAADIAEKIVGQLPASRIAGFVKIKNKNQVSIDSGIAIYFKAPRSFTGEDVVEIQCHGGVVLVNMIVKTAVSYGARLARPGEFSERAFLNGKMDLIQAEAVSDLINASTESAALSAHRSLTGDFSTKIKKMQNNLNELRVFVEAAIDFVEEEIDFLTQGQVLEKIEALMSEVQTLLQQAQSGKLLQEGAVIVLAGRPNVGKSSLLNYLAKQELAIVTDLPGTTRDIIKTTIEVSGVPLHFVDTAGLRDTSDRIEQIGVSKAKEEYERADCIVWLCDVTQVPFINSAEQSILNLYADKVIIVANKIDLIEQDNNPRENALYVSVKQQLGLDSLIQALQKRFEFPIEGAFSARQRHILALEKAYHHIYAAQKQLVKFQAGEIIAEELKLTQENLSELTGAVTSDDLLGHIFSTFCIGK